MSTLYRETALSVYRWITRAQRARLVRSFERDGSFPACVLFYHRISDTTKNAWTMTSRNFERQIDWISKYTNPVSLDDIRESQISAIRSKRMVGITFDDGYGENCDIAMPLLLQKKIPVTYFVSTHFVESGEPFPHDIEAGVPLRPNTIAEIKRMAADGVEIGAHSHTHIDLGQNISSQRLKIEVHDVRKKLQDWTGQSVNYFAFPIGLQKNISQSAIDAVMDAGFKCFTSAAGGMNFPGQCASHLQRIHADPGMAAVKNWLTFDPRKVGKPSPILFKSQANTAIPSSTSVAPLLGCSLVKSH